MSRMYTFHETVRGYFHIKNGYPCEDASVSLSAEDGRYHIAVVADGHGSSTCFRSEYGARAAVLVASECLRQFAGTVLASEETEDRFYQDLFSNPRYRQMTIRQLTDTILAGWYDRILEDYENNPPSAEEPGEGAAEYENGKSPAHIYGTTLIAALQLPKCLLLLHQGDGRCEVFFPDGSVEQPVPWDARCEDAVTTSLCDEDAAESFRSHVIDLEAKPVMACYLGSDGVEDAYRDTYEALGGSHVRMGGVHTFYKALTCQLAKMGQAEFEAYLKELLPEFSANGKFSRSGSGDDVSVAGIVDLDTILQFVAEYECDVKRYELEEELFWKEDELRGKTRKHGILQKRREEAQSALQAAQERQQELEGRLFQLRQQREEYAKEAGQAKAELEEYRQESQAASEQMEGKFLRVANEVRRFISEISDGYAQKEAAYEKMLEELSEYDERIKQGEEEQSAGAEEIRELEEKLAGAQAVFEEYDVKYQAIDAERRRMEGEIAALRWETSGQKEEKSNGDEITGREDLSGMSGTAGLQNPMDGF